MVILNADVAWFLCIPEGFPGGRGGYFLLCVKQLLLKVARGEWIRSEKHGIGHEEQWRDLYHFQVLLG